MVMHKNKLNKNLVKDAKEFNIFQESFEKQKAKFLKKFKNINDRIEYIVIKLIDFYKLELIGWSYNNCSFDDYEGYETDGSFEPYMLLKEDFSICANFIEKELSTTEILLKDGTYNPFKNSYYDNNTTNSYVLLNEEMFFPTRWIFEDFEEELEKSRILYEIGKIKIN
jgi:hypothetical protein